MKTLCARLVVATILAAAAGSLLPAADTPAANPGPLADRKAIEKVLWSHRIWPEVNPTPKPVLATVLPDAVIGERIADDVRKRAALEQYWSRRVTAAQVQAELDRMAAHTKSPKVLAEIFAALDNDPQRIAPALAEPALVDRLIRSWYAGDGRFHAAARGRAERALLRPRASEDLKSLDGEYHEVEYVLSGESTSEFDGRSPSAVSLERAAWDGLLVRLRAALDAGGAGSGLPRDLPRGVTSRLVEEGDAFRVYRILDSGPDRIVVVSVAWPKKSFESWWRDSRAGLTPAPAPTAGRYTLPAVAGACVDDTWTPIITASPEGRQSHSAVWTGSEMIIWGGYGASGALNTGGRYNPATDTWVPTGIDGQTPAPRTVHTAVWTGTEMIVWGGGTFPGVTYALRSGGRYDPQTDSWAAVRNDATSPSERINHAAVWTGSRMIIWGGGDASCNCGYLKTGAQYDPAADAWTPTRADLTAPEARSAPTAVWTGSEMIVYGGFKQSVCCIFGHTDVDTGGRYNPVSDTWTLIQGGGGRSAHTAVWTAGRMVVWGGISRTPDIRTGQDVTTQLRTGSRYDLASNTWIPTSITPSTPTARSGHTAVWSGSTMVVWGGSGNPGARYDPVSDDWAAVRNDATAPPQVTGHTALWTGSEMIVWGGGSYSYGGGRYDPALDTWVRTAVDNPFAGGSPPQGNAVWTGSEMLVWSGPASAGRYSPVTDTWSAMTQVNAPVARTDFTSVWTGTDMIVWGGLYFSTPQNGGGAYNPTLDQWGGLPGQDAPSPRSQHSAVWTGTEMIVWGGYACCTYYPTGGRFNPATYSWSPTRANGTAPTGRSYHTAVWTGSEMIIWGGYNDNLPAPPFALNSGARYDPVNDTWHALPADASGPEARYFHSAVWTGTEMIAWGGLGVNGSTSQSRAGWAYAPGSDGWRRLLDDATSPEARYFHTAVWSGQEMIVWGGCRSNTSTDFLNTGGRYTPADDHWSTTLADGSTPSRRRGPSGVHTGEAMLVWGGLSTTAAQLPTGGAYCSVTCDLGTFYRDADSDGHGDAGDSVAACNLPPGYSAAGDDCVDQDAQAWNTPGEARDLLLSGIGDLAWSPPTAPGGAWLLYDVVRSTDRADFVNAGVCLASGLSETTMSDSDVPALGNAFYYLVRAVGGCPAGTGIFGTASNGTPVAGPACP